MLATFGYGVLLITFVLCLYGIGAAVFGGVRKQNAWVESARLAMLLTFPLITLSALTIIYLLVTNHFEFAYVYSVTSRSMPMYLKVTALWGGQAGSLVFWSWLLAAFVSAVTLRKWQRDREFLPWVIVVALVTLAFFLGMILFVENPFVRFWVGPAGTELRAMFPPAGSTMFAPPDGMGLNPLLRHPGMVIHPPMLYLGFVSFVIPFAFAVAALITGRVDDRWIRLTRRWTLVAWLFLSLGLVLGSRWAYDVLGWGGYWAWDPVEIAALNPWLSGTAFLHSVMIQEKRGMLKKWNMILIILTYTLVILGTFFTRSGVLSSVHAFAQSAIGPLFFGFIAIMLIGSLGLLLYRWNALRSENHLGSLFSRESLFLYNNLVFLLILAVCLWGMLFPLISELFTNQKVTFGPPWYEQITGPLFALLLLLMGVAPLSAWGHTNYKLLGRNIWKPAATSLLIPVWAALAGVRNPLAFLAFWLIALVGFITLYEYGRAVAARSRAQKEPLLTSFWRLAGRNRRRYGGYIIHLGVVLMALGIVGIEMFQSETQRAMRTGDSVVLSGYTVAFNSIAEFRGPDGRIVTRAVVDVAKNGRSLGQLYPRVDYYLDSQQSMTIPGVRSTWEDDLYIILAAWEPVSSQGATLKVYHNPLINWLWVGGLIFILGTFVAAWPDKDPEVERVRNRVQTKTAEVR